MKSVILFIVLIIFPVQLFAHGYPTIEEFQMFPGTFTQAVIANPAGGIVAVPFAIVGGTVGAAVGLISLPFHKSGSAIGESTTAGVVFIGMCGYMVGQQIGWPFYGLERGIGWCLE